MYLHCLRCLALTVIFAGLWACDGTADSDVTTAPGSRVALAGGHGALPSPAPAGSRLPHLASDPTGQPVLSWVQEHGGAHQLRYAVLTDAGWTPPVTVAQGGDWFVNWADFPAVHPLDDTLWAAHWLVKQPGGMYAYDIAVSLSRDGGRSWGAPFRPHRDGTPTEHGFVSMWPAPLPDGGTGAGMIWLDGRHMLFDPSRGGSQEARTVLHSAVFDAYGVEVGAAEVDDRVCDCCQTAVAVTSAGPLAAYRDRGVDEVRDIHVAARRAEDWQDLGPVAADGWVIEGCPVNGPALAARGDRVAIAWYTEAGGARRVQVSVGTAGGHAGGGGAAWSAPVRVDAGATLGRVDVAILDDGDAVVSWLGRADQDSASILLARIGADGAVGEPLPVAAVAADRPAGFPQMIRHRESLVLAWTEWRDGTPRVQATQIGASALPPGHGGGGDAGPGGAPDLARRYHPRLVL